jgi:hypothetical protein
MEKFLVNDIVEQCGLEGKVIESFINDDGLACVVVKFLDGEEDTFLEDGRVDTRFKKSALTLVNRPATARTYYINLYKKLGSATLIPGSRLFESKEVAEAKGRASTEMSFIKTVSFSVTA